MVKFGYNNNEIFSKGQYINIKAMHELEKIYKETSDIIQKIKSEEIFEGPIEDDFDNKWKNNIKSFSNNTILPLLLLAKLYPNIGENYKKTDNDNSKTIGGVQ